MYMANMQPQHSGVATSLCHVAQFLSRRKELNDRLVVHEVAGYTSNTLSKRSTCGNNPLTSGIMFCMTLCACLQ